MAWLCLKTYGSSVLSESPRLPARSLNSAPIKARGVALTTLSLTKLSVTKEALFFLEEGLFLHDLGAKAGPNWRTPRKARGGAEFSGRSFRTALSPAV